MVDIKPKLIRFNRERYFHSLIEERKIAHEKRSSKTINNVEQIKQQTIRSSSAIFYFIARTWFLLVRRALKLLLLFPNVNVNVIDENEDNRWVASWQLTVVGLKKGSEPITLFENDHQLMVGSRFEIFFGAVRKYSLQQKDNKRFI